MKAGKGSTLDLNPAEWNTIFFRKIFSNMLQSSRNETILCGIAMTLKGHPMQPLSGRVGGLGAGPDISA